MTTTSAEYVALLRTVVSDPRDDTARLVLADWFEENGQGDLAAWVRWQCHSGVAFRREVRSGKWRNKMKRGVDVPSRAAWQGLNLYLSHPWPDDFIVSRGFVSAVTLPTWAEFMRPGFAAGLFAWHPIERVEIEAAEPNDNGRRGVTSFPHDVIPDTWFWQRATPGEDPRRLVRWEVPWVLCEASSPPDFTSRGAAYDWLSARCVAWGRRQAGLRAEFGPPEDLT
jgi:uncharacterized protein (TIGR02996 family)